MIIILPEERIKIKDGLVHINVGDPRQFVLRYMPEAIYIGREDNIRFCLRESIIGKWPRDENGYLEQTMTDISRMSRGRYRTSQMIRDTVRDMTEEGILIASTNESGTVYRRTENGI